MANPLPTFYVGIGTRQYGSGLQTSNFRSEDVSSINGEAPLTISHSKDMLRGSATASGMNSQVLDGAFGKAAPSCEEDSSRPSYASFESEASTNDETNAVSTIRTTRAQSSKEKLYDMTFEQIDPVIRSKPKKSRPRKVNNIASSAPKIGNSRKLRASASGKDNAFRECSKGNRQSRRMDNNLFAKPIQEDWKKLNALDRRVYRLQHGTPIKGDAIPLKWSTVVKTLIRERFFSREQCITWGGEKALKKRYEMVRKAMQVFFGGVDYEEEPSSRKNWTILTMEGWEVFDIGSSATVRKPQSTTENNDEGQDLNVAGEERDAEFHDTIEFSASQISDDSSNKHNMMAREANEEMGIEDLSHFITHTSQVDFSRIIGEPLMTEEEVEKAYEDHLSQEQAADISESDTPTSSSMLPQVITAPEVTRIAPSAPHFNMYENPKSPGAKAIATTLLDPSSPIMDTTKAHQIIDEDNDIEEARKLLFSQFKAKDHTTQNTEKAALPRTLIGANFRNTLDTLDTQESWLHSFKQSSSFPNFSYSPQDFGACASWYSREGR